jgi:hypothetical protein
MHVLLTYLIVYLCESVYVYYLYYHHSATDSYRKKWLLLRPRSNYSAVSSSTSITYHIADWVSWKFMHRIFVYFVMNFTIKISYNLWIPNIEIKRNEIKTKRVSPLISIDEIKPSKREKKQIQRMNRRKVTGHIFILADTVDKKKTLL